VSDRIVSMVDIGPTFLDAAGIAVPKTMDGSSLLSPLSSPRLMGLVEYHGETGDGGAGDPVCKRTAGSNLFGSADGTYNTPPFWNGSEVCVMQDSANNTYNCLRIIDPTTQADARFCEFTELTEYVDYSKDPYELINSVGTLAPAAKAAMHDRLAAVATCVGSAACDALLMQPM